MNDKDTFNKGDIYESHAFKVTVFDDGYGVLYDDPIIDHELLLLFANKYEPIGHIRARLKALRDALNSVDLEMLI